MVHKFNLYLLFSVSRLSILILVRIDHQAPYISSTYIVPILILFDWKQTL